MRRRECVSEANLISNLPLRQTRELKHVSVRIELMYLMQMLLLYFVIRNHNGILMLLLSKIPLQHIRQDEN